MAWFLRGPRLAGVTAATLVRVSALDHRCNACQNAGAACKPGMRVQNWTI
jgi:hypothetical protein